MSRISDVEDTVYFDYLLDDVLNALDRYEVKPCISSTVHTITFVNLN